MNTRRAAGFTLLEIIVALVVLGFVTAGLFQGVRFGLHATNYQANLIDRRSSLEACDRVLRRLIESMDPGSETVALPTVGLSSRVAFTTQLPLAMRPTSTALASIELLVEPKLGLVLRWRPYLHAVQTEAAPARDVVLLPGVERLDLAYWSLPGRRGGGWTRRWTESEPPSLVRLHLAFPTGDRRHWPDIVVAPRRSARAD